jgi:hypothetical protein
MRFCETKQVFVQQSRLLLLEQHVMDESVIGASTQVRRSNAVTLQGEPRFTFFYQGI